jgi:hypothetical protein
MSEMVPEETDGDTSALAEGEAALWLSESLILALLEAKVLNTEAVLEAIDIVIAAKQAATAESGDGRHRDISRAAAAQLAAISSSIAAARAAASPGQIGRTRRGSPRRTDQR